jgi:hypothetical protein
MKRRIGTKSRRERAKATTQPLADNRFLTFMLFREITVSAKPRNSELP